MIAITQAASRSTLKAGIDSKNPTLLGDESGFRFVFVQCAVSVVLFVYGFSKNPK
jgi:hypothetical protein